MIEATFRTLLAPAIGTTPLTEPSGETAGWTAIAMRAVTMRADEEHGATAAAHANSLSQNRFAMCRHVRSQAALDNGNGFMAA